MTSILRSTSRFWEFLMTEAADNRTKGWFFVDSPVPPLILLVLYFQAVKRFGPAYMKDRKPFNLNKIMQIYNILQVIFCGYMTYEGFRLTFGPNGAYSWHCQPLDRSMSPLGIKVAKITWLYYMIKICDLLDTIFIVLRKKFNQASFLHVYHHIGVVILGYIACKYYPDGHGFLLVPLNSFVHCIMYMYYFLTNYNPDYAKKIWWKKYITQIQIVQFLLLFVHVGKLLFIPACGYPLLPVFLFLPQVIVMLVLFSNFYKNAYLMPKKAKAS